MIKIIANGGNCLSLPDHTMEAFWAGFSSGCDGLYTVIHQSCDGVLLLSRENNLSINTDGKGLITELNYDEIESFDAASFFLKEKNYPWKRNDSKGYLVQIPSLEELLFYVPRGLNLYVELANESYNKFGDTYLQNVVSSFERTPVPVNTEFITNNFEVLEKLRNKFNITNLAFKITKEPENDLWIRLEKKLLEKVIIDEHFFNGFFNRFYDNHNDKIRLALIGNYNSNEEIIDSLLEKYKSIDELILPDYDLFFNKNKKCSYEISEKFEGKIVNNKRWKFGYARIDNIETQVFQDDGFHIEIKEGLQYSGGSAVSVFPIRGNFTITVGFTITNPQTAGTMELAVINTYANRSCEFVKKADRQDDSFDVHSAPPFVCVENDEADGFRVMNNLCSTTYTNRYNRDVGEGKCLNGHFRLDRVGPYFTGYYKDKTLSDWVGCGSIINESLNDLVFIRMGAKHWEKGNKPYPANHITFKDLKVYFFNSI